MDDRIDIALWQPDDPEGDHLITMSVDDFLVLCEHGMQKNTDVFTNLLISVRDMYGEEKEEESSQEIN